MNPTGYLHEKYARSLEEFGEPRALAASGGWVLVRPVPKPDARDGKGAGYGQDACASQKAHDAMGCYPLFCCRDWSKLPEDLAQLGRDLVSLALVSDPFGCQDVGTLQSSFDRVIHFKDHLLVDISKLEPEFGNRHHRYYARKALKEMRVEECADPLQNLDEWQALYATLIERHHLKGIKAFSRASFAGQLQTPGLVMFRAMSGEQVVGAQLWYIQGDVAYSHLTAVSDAGYNLRATYGLYWAAIESLRKRAADGLRWLDLGAGAGLAGASADGLTQFKAGWANDCRPVYFCGKVFDSDRYQRMTHDAGASLSSYFPAYRHGEFA